ncbi:MAG TPA: BadF/BadG/BcrA/BcrD ATPase family protein [Vicinamibacterales bacterium]|jgi:activator of 2-hydroxyglutaryl-CoA dehydratase/predicted nucleotide-binding protein (sugar kinase/HSP70/actin superfamily)
MTVAEPRFLLGLDVGSTTVKAVAIDARTDELVWRDYQRHESRPAEKLLELLTRLEDEAGVERGSARAFITGSSGAAFADLVGAHYVQEVAAVALAVEQKHPDARTVIELGGQDAKIIIFEAEDEGRSRKTVSMNDKCAGGTGVVIDKISAKLKISSEALGTQPYVGLKIYPIAGKCGVFAETDINGLQKRGVAAEELLASLFDAIVVQNLTVLSRGHALPPHVLLLGGPHAFIRGLREAWQTHVPGRWRERGVELPEGTSPEDLIVTPPMAEYYGAFGAIEFARRDREATTDYLGPSRLAASVARGHEGVRRGATGVGFSGMDLAEFRKQYERPAWTPPPLEPGQFIRSFIGLDAGSTSTKAVMLDEDGRVLAKAYQLSRGNPIEDAIEMFGSLRRQIESQGARTEVSGVVTTGYAKDILKDVFAADAALVETVAHAQSALHFYKDPHVIVDVGGQDIKIIVMHGGRVKDFRLNTQCSAGNGYFLQAIAQSFGRPVEEFAEAAFTAREMPVFGQGCVLFLQSEISNVQRHGWKPEEVLAGLAAVLPRNVFLYVAKAPNLSRFGWRFVLQGGTQRNLAAVKAQVDFIRDNFKGQERQPDIVLHEHCGEAGAIGAGLEAVRLWKHGNQTRFIGLEAAERIAFETRCDDETRCHFCKNECVRTFIDVTVAGPAATLAAETPAEVAAETAAAVERVAHRRFVVAGCEKGSAEDLAHMRDIKAAEDAVKARTPNLVTFASREVWKLRNPANVADPLPPKGWTAAAKRRRELYENRHKVRIGLPRVFNMYALAPFFTGYLQSVGVDGKNIVFSDYTSMEMYRTGATRGAIDPCFPSKVSLAHVHNLLFVKHKRTPLDCIFFPMIEVLPPRLHGVRASNACPTVSLTPQTVRAAFTKDEDLFAQQGVQYLAGILDMEDEPLFRRQMLEMWEPLLGLSWEENQRAIAAGHQALADYETAVRTAARKALDDLERDNRLGIVLLGRPYHHDPGLNHGIPEELQKLGYPVFSQHTLPLDEDLLDRLFGDDVRNGLIRHPLDISDVWKNSLAASSNFKVWAAKFAARHPNLVAVELSNFKCGHDAPIFATVEDIIEKSGTPYFGFKEIDENKPTGAIKLRLETIDYSLKRAREELLDRGRRTDRMERWLAAYERRLRRQLAPPDESESGEAVTM